MTAASSGPAPLDPVAGPEPAPPRPAGDTGTGGPEPAPPRPARDTGTGPGRRAGGPGRRRRLLPGRTEVLQLPDFVRLWAGQTLSQTGSQVTAVALPLIAVDRLGAGPGAMGLLAAAGRLPYLLYLVAGVWVDRVRKRRLMISLDLARGALLLTVPLAAVLDVLTLWLLGAVLAGVITLSVWFETAYLAYVPALVGRDRLLQGNSVMESSASAAQAVGPGLGGLLVQVLTAPVAVVVDALSFVASATWLARIRQPEPAPRRDDAASRTGLRAIAAEVGQGVGFVARHPILRPLALAIGLNQAVWAAELALYVLYLVRELQLSPLLVGLTLTAGGPGAVLGSAVAGRVQRRFGVSGAIIGGLATFALAAVLIPLAPQGHRSGAVALLMLAAFVMAAGGQVCVVNVLTTRQLAAPEHLLGRVNASFRFVTLGLSSVGAVAGGVLGSALGLRTALVVAVAGMLLAPLLLAASPVRRLRDLPLRADAP